LLNRILSPLDRNLFLSFLVFCQLAKLAIILSQPNSQGFIEWFYGFHRYAPYSFDNLYQHTIPFPVPYSGLWYAFYDPLTTF
jgi:hypothetical protein